MKNGRCDIRTLAIAGVVVALATLGGAPRAAAQRGDVDAALLRCAKMSADAWTMLPNPPDPLKDSVRYRKWERLSKVRSDSLTAAAKTCLATIQVASVTDTVLDSLATLQWRIGDGAAAVPTLRRLLSSSLPIDRRVQSVAALLGYLKPAREVMTLRAGFIPVADSAGDVKVAAKARWEYAKVVREVDSMFAYGAVDEFTQYLSTLDSAGLAAAAPSAASALNDIGYWAHQDGMIRETIGLSAALVALYPKNRAVLDGPARLAKRVTRIGKQAPAFESPFWLNADSGVTRRDFAKGRVTIMEFTESWCTPCKLSYRPLQRLSQELGPKGLDVLFVVTVYGLMGPEQKPRKGAGEFVLKQYSELFKPYGVTFPVIATETKKYHDWYAADGVPQLVLIDRHGRVRYVSMGWTEGKEVPLTQKIMALLAEP